MAVQHFDTNSFSDENHSERSRESVIIRTSIIGIILPYAIRLTVMIPLSDLRNSFDLTKSALGESLHSKAASGRI